MSIDTPHTPRTLIPVTEWPNHYTYPPIGQLRALIFNADKNNFSHCIRRIGRRIMIDPQAYFTWVDSQNGFDTSDTTSAQGGHND